jgi:hypothetical protein
LLLLLELLLLLLLLLLHGVHGKNVVGSDAFATLLHGLGGGSGVAILTLKLESKS